MRISTIKVIAAWLILSLCGAMAHAGTVTYVYTDAQGTPLANADANGYITAMFDYQPYGAQALGLTPDGIGYTGHVNDVESGLVYMQQRYYDPVIGRFLSVDPVSAYSMPSSNFNRYWYANNNPYRFTDPDGRLASDEEKHESPPPPPEPKTLPPVTVTATPPVVTLPAITVTAPRPIPMARPITLPAWVSVGAGAWASAPLLLLYSPHPCGGDPCGELVMESGKYNPGFWPGDKGAEAWGRRNGVGAAEGRRRFHGIKQRDKGQGGGKGRDDYGTNPNTGEVQNPQGETVGDLNDG